MAGLGKRGFAHGLRCAFGGMMEFRRSGHSRANAPRTGLLGDRNSVAIVGLACRFPDAGDTTALFEVIIRGRRAFRRIPGAEGTACLRGALIEGWRFDRGAFGISPASYLGAEPAHWLALETAARALAAAGFPGGSGLPGGRIGVFIGNTLGSGLSAPAICGRLGFGGGGLAVDAGAASSLAAVASACAALTAGELDAAIAGGVEVSLDRAGMLAVADMRIYDQHPTGFLPGQGCGMVLLMRTADAVAADLPVLAEILGVGMASAGQQGRLLALRRAYENARVDPADVQLIEGSGTAVGSADEAELTALVALRSGSGRPARPASIGAATANFGNTGAAAGAAGLIKAVLAMTSGVLPPTVGVGTPHQLLRDGSASLRASPAPHPWPAGTRHAGVSASSLDGLSAHVVLRGHSAEAGSGHRVVSGRPAAAVRAGRERPYAFLLHAPDRVTLTAVLSRIADIAPWISDSELSDLACQLATDAVKQGKIKVAIVATAQEQLGRLATEAIAVVAKLTGRVVSARPGIFAADDADGRVTLLLAGQPQLSPALAVLRRLDELGVQPTAAAGHGAGELAGLVWAGCVSPAGARALNDIRAAVLAAPATAAPGNLGSAIDEFAGYEFRPPRRRLISGSAGAEVTSQREIANSLSAELLDAWSAARQPPVPSPAGQPLANAVRIGADGASLLLQSGPDRDLTRAIGQAGLAGRRRPVPVVSIGGDPADPGSIARAAAALFTAGALTRADRLYPAHQSRPFDIWREQIFISRPGKPRARVRREPDAIPRAAAGQHGTPPDEPEVAGVAPWYRCYAERTTEPAGLIDPPGDGPWRVYTGGCDFLRDEVFDLFPAEPAAGRTLAVLGELHEAGAVETALLAAQDAIATRELVAVSRDPAWAGLWATLHAEHPVIGITVVRTAMDAAGLRAASRIGATPGGYRELMIGTDGSVRELAMAPAPIGRTGAFPLGQDDVVLISRGAGAAGLALAQVLACCGAGVAVVGRDHPGRDDALVATLEELRQAGAPIGYEIVNPASAAALAAALRRIERRLGHVTAVAHAVGTAAPHPLAGLDPAGLRADAAGPARLLDQLVTAARAPGGDGTPGALKLIITFGTVASRYGLAGNAGAALATSALADRAQTLAAASPGCRALHVDWPAWPGAAPMPVAERSRLLLSVLAADLPARLAVHGRVGSRAPRAIAVTAPADPGPAGRFAERVLVHYPGVELVAEATLDIRTDPYLAGYAIDGTCLLPPAIAVEAMAQAASVLAGAPVRSATDLLMNAPVVLSPRQPAVVLRLCALAADDAVTVILRCDTTEFAVDHFRAAFMSEPKPVSRVLTGGNEQATGTVKARDLYGPVCFQTGRFKRLASVRFAGSRTALALTSRPDEQAWFATPGRPLEQ